MRAASQLPTNVLVYLHVNQNSDDDDDDDNDICMFLHISNLLWKANASYLKTF